jgi:hypothetical protein
MGTLADIAALIQPAGTNSPSEQIHSASKQATTSSIRIQLRDHPITRYYRVQVIDNDGKLKLKLRGLSPRKNYTDRVTAACRRC